MKNKLFQIAALLLITSAIAILISMRSCVKRNVQSKTGSSNNVFIINAPLNLIAIPVMSSQIDLAWQDNSNNDNGFEIERRTMAGEYSPIATVDSDITSYSDINLTPFTTYFYRVRALNTIGDRSSYSNEVSVTTMAGVIWLGIAAGEAHTFAIAEDGGLWSWGWNYNGQLGFSDTNNRNTPSRIGLETDWSFVEAGSYHSLAIKTDRTLWVWGNNENGQLGLGDADFDRYQPEQVGIESDWIYVSGGGYHTIGMKSNPPGGEAGGTLWAWGWNSAWNGSYMPGGQLGVGDVFGRYTPTQIGTGSDWSLISCGYDHTLAVKTLGTLWAWGFNAFGQVGDGTVFYRITPKQIGVDSIWIAVSAGGSRSAAIKANPGTLWVWGVNYTGYPVQTGVSTDWVNVSVSGVATSTSSFTLAKKSDNTLWAWGDNDYGQLGIGSTIDKTTPVQIGANSNWSIFTTGGFHSLAINNDGNLWLWGRNTYGQLGLGDTNNANIPYALGPPIAPSSLVITAVSGIQIDLTWQDNAFNEYGFKIERSADGTNFGLIGETEGNVTFYSDEELPPAGTVYYRVRAYNVFGYSPYSNQKSMVISGVPLSLVAAFSGTQISLSWIDTSNTESGFKIERKVTINGEYSQISTVGSNIVSCLDAGVSPGVYYWYRVRAYNEAGDSLYSNEAYSAISGNWKQISVGGNHTIGLKSTGTIWVWGSNAYGQLGLENITRQKTPAQLGCDTDWVAVATVYNDCIALKSNNTLWGWGRNNYGQLGDGTTDRRDTPREIGTNSDWSFITAGHYHTIGLKGINTLWVWGRNNYGQLGDGTSNNRNTPMQIGTDSNWVFMAAGERHTIGVKNTGTLWAWGGNGDGQLGDGTTNNRFTPRQIGVDSDWISAAAGYSHTISLKSTGQLWAWGKNNYGQLGDGTLTQRLTPRQIGVDTDWSYIATGTDQNIARKNIGTLWSWGNNNCGQLGEGTTSDRTTPRQIGIDSDWSIQRGMAAELQSTLALKSNNTLWGWGKNSWDQLGLGDTKNKLTPTLVGE